MERAWNAVVGDGLFLSWRKGTVGLVAEGLVRPPGRRTGESTALQGWSKQGLDGGNGSGGSERGPLGNQLGQAKPLG